MTVKKKTVKSTRVEQQMRKKLDKVNVQHLTEKKKSLEMISMDSAEMTSEMTSMVNDVEVQKRKTRSKAEGDSYFMVMCPLNILRGEKGHAFKWLFFAYKF